MKKIFLLLILLISFNTYSQISYPRYEKDVNGYSIVLLTLEQAQKLDSNMDILELFEKLNLQITNYDSVTISLINKKNKIITTQGKQIIDLEDRILLKDNIIKNINSSLNIKDLENVNLTKQLVISKEEFNLTKKENKKLKSKMIIGGTISGLSIVSLILLLL